jgi:hypothetical protein
MQYFSDMIKWGTHSNYSHVAMVIRDPTFTDPPLKGLYIWESGWEGKPDPQDGKTKLGVQITPFNEVLANFQGSKIIVRKMQYGDDSNPDSVFSTGKLRSIHVVVHDKPYDIFPRDWIDALFHRDPEPQKTSRFWCSALVGYIYTQCGVLKGDTDWSVMTPADFSLDGEDLNYWDAKDCSLDNKETRIR